MFPSWVAPVGLSALVLGGLAMLRKKEPGPGDVVVVPLARLALADGTMAPPQLAQIVPGGALVAVTVTSSANGRIVGTGYGMADPNTMAPPQPTPALAAFPPLSLARADVAGIFRGTPLRKV